MNDIVFLNGSPKKRKAISEKLIVMLKEILGDEIQSEIIYLYEFEDNEEIIEEIYNSDSVIISLPLYVDSLPAGVLEFFQKCLRYSTERKKEKPKFYFMINCGFMEDRQNDTAIKILEKYSEKLGFEFKGGLSVGAGAMIFSLDKEYLIREEMKKLSKDIIIGFGKSEKKCFDSLTGKTNKTYFEEIEPDKNDSLIYRVSIDMPRFLFKAKSDKVWVDAAAKKGLGKRDLKKKYYK